jgi:CRISPR-associated protein Cmr6
MRHPIVSIREQRVRGQHPGLLLARYLAEQNDDGRDKRELFKAACGAGRDQSLIALYRRAFERWREGLSGVKDEADLGTPPFARLIVGLGNKGVIEAGLRLHHTYGVPLIPGSALKGLASHYCHEVYGAADERFRRDKQRLHPEEQYHKLLFGTAEDGGVIRFEDAWMHPDSLGAPDQGLLADVMTPHHQKWQTDPHAAPTDFDSPVPVPYLSVAGRFHVALVWQGPEHAEARRWTELALVLLRKALQEWGVGGKTTSGYGRLVDLRGAAAPKSSPSTVGAATPATSTRGGGVTVKFLGPHEKLKNAFWVQEEGKKRGLLKYGTAPTPLPAPDSEIEVYRTGDNPQSPEYRWDKAKPPPQPRGKRPPRGGRR